MGSTRRLIVAALVLAGGGLGAPFLSLPSRHFGWQLYAQVYQSDLEIDKSSDAAGPLQLGSQFSYTVTVTNNGPADATGVSVEDAVPDGVDYVSDTCGGSYAPATHSWSWSIGALAASAEVSCDILVEVATAHQANLVNAVVVTGNEPDPTPGNNSSSTADQAIATPVPLLSSTGFMVLVLSIVVLTVVILRRRGPPL